MILPIAERNCESSIKMRLRFRHIAPAAVRIMLFPRRSGFGLIVRQ
jgi:hypothetical protein